MPESLTPEGIENLKNIISQMDEQGEYYLAAYCRRMLEKYLGSAA